MEGLSEQRREEAEWRRVEATARPAAAAWVLLAGVAGLLLSFVLSVSLGAADIDFADVWLSVLQLNPDPQQSQIIMDIRLPRVIGAACVGCSLAVAGAIMQGMTRNPLADSGLLGLNAGAAFMLAVCFAFMPGLPYMYIVLCSFAGAALGAAAVYGIGSMARNGLTPVRLVLAGTAVSALLSALSEGIALRFRVAQDLVFWFAGGVSGTRWSHLAVIAPGLLAALAGALVLSRSITILSLGEDVAAGLGQRTGLVKLLGVLFVLVLAGTAVAVVGPVSFVGLIVPHAARWLVGHDYRWIIPASAVLGAVLVVLADLAARMINPPHEIPIGVLIALIGVPFFLYLARKRTRVMS